MTYRAYIRMLQSEYASRYAEPVPPMPQLLAEPWISAYLKMMFPSPRPAGAPPVSPLPGSDDAPGVPGPGDVPATWLGWQPGWPPGAPAYGLWNLTEPVCGRPAGSTVVTETLTVAGYAVVEPPRPPRQGERPCLIP